MANKLFRRLKLVKQIDMRWTWAVSAILLIMLGTLSIYALIHWQETYHTIEQFYYSLQKPSAPTFHQSRIETMLIDSAALHTSRESKIYIPEEYDHTVNQRFPVLYLLHGDPGNNNDWLINARLQYVLDDLIDKHQLQPLLVVFPDGNGPIVKDSQYVDATQIDQKMATFISQELVDMVDKKYRTQSDRLGRAIGGISSGGYGAVNLLLHFPERYSMAFSLSGYFMNHQTVTKQLFGSDYQALASNNPLDEIKKMKLPKNTSFFLEIGSKDNPEWLLEQEQMKEAIIASGGQVSVQMNDGGHGWLEWQKSIVSALQIMNADLVKNATASAIVKP